MNFSQLLLILRARMGTILLTLLVTVLATVAASLLLPKTYKATVTLVLNYKGTDPVTGLTLPAQLMPGYMATQVDIISSRNVAQNVAKALQLADDKDIKKDFQEDTGGEGDINDWLGERMLKRLRVEPSRESSVLGISYKGQNPELVAAIANGFATEYQKVNIQLKTEPLRNASNYFTQQVKVLRDNLEAAQGKLSAAQQEKGIVNLDSRVDVETERLNDLSSQLVAVQGRLSEALSRKREVAGRRADESPDVVSNPLIQNLKSSLAQAEAKLSQMADGVTPDYPPYKAAKAEVDKLRSELKRHVRAIGNSVGNNALVLQRNEADLRKALLAQRNKVLELNRQRDQLAVLARDVDSAQRAYDLTMQRFNQTNLEGQANQTDVSVLSMATVPVTPYSPKLLLNTLLAIFLGTMLGVTFSLLAEKNDPRVRSGTDLVSVLQAPLLGTVSWRTVRRRRLSFGRRMLPGAPQAS